MVDIPAIVSQASAMTEDRLKPFIPPPDTAEQIKEKLQSLLDDDRLDVSAIKGVDDIIKGVEKKIPVLGKGGGGGSRRQMAFADLSSQTNGSLKVFSVPKSTTAIVICSDFPTILMENNGFTLNAARTTLTLTITNAPSSGAQLLFQYSSLFNLI